MDLPDEDALALNAEQLAAAQKCPQWWNRRKARHVVARIGHDRDRGVAAAVPTGTGQAVDYGAQSREDPYR